MHNNKTREALVNHQRIDQRKNKSEKLVDRLNAGPRILIKNPSVHNQGTISNITTDSIGQSTQIATISNENQSLQNIIQSFMDQLNTLQHNGLNDQAQQQVSLIGSILNPTTGPGRIEPQYLGLPEEIYIDVPFGLPPPPPRPLPIGYELGSIESKQTKVIDLLEQKLYETILGGTYVVNKYSDSTVKGLLDQVAKIYGDVSYETSTQPIREPGYAYITTDYLSVKKYTGLTGALQQAIINLTGTKEQSLSLNSDTLRNLLYQARDLKTKLPASPQPLTPYGQTSKLATIVSSINKQESVIGLLENRLQSAILGDVNVGDIYRDQSSDSLLMYIANIYGDKSKVDSRFGFDPSGNPVDGTGTSIKGLIDVNGNINGPAYNNYLAGLTTPTQIANAVRLHPAYTGLTGAMQKGVTDFQQTDASGNPLPLEADALRQLLMQSRSLLREQNISYQAEIKQQAPYPVFMGGMVQTIQTMMQQLNSMLQNILGMGCTWAPKVPTPIPIYIGPWNGGSPIDGSKYAPPVTAIACGIAPIDELQQPSKAQLYSETIRSQIEDLVSQGALDPEHAEFTTLQTLMATYSAMKSS